MYLDSNFQTIHDSTGRANAPVEFSFDSRYQVENPRHYPLGLHNLCTEVVIVHGNELRLYDGHGIPPTLTILKSLAARHSSSRSLVLKSIVWRDFWSRIEPDNSSTTATNAIGWMIIISWLKTYIVKYLNIGIPKNNVIYI